MLLRQHRLDPERAKEELPRFAAFLDDHPFFPETEVVERLKGWPNLTVLIGCLGRGFMIADSFKYEFGVQGAVYADLALGSVSRSSAVLVEFEGGEAGSIFASGGTQQLPAWSRQIEHATSQLIDWSWVLADSGRSALLASNLGLGDLDVQFIVVCGRSSSLSDPLARLRYSFRRSKLSIARSSVVFLTFDELLKELGYALPLFWEKEGSE